MGAGGARAARRSRRRGWRTTTTCSRSAAAWSATSRASAPRPTSAACPSCSCRRRSSRRSTPPTAARPGVDLPEGKNYAGAYHQPAAVLADPTVLATLPAAELAAGWAEVIKTALIAGGPLWDRVRGPRAIVDADLVLACARTKLAVVAEDERDQGRRQVLNLGHTVGHGDRDRDGLRALPPRRGGRPRAARGADALRPAGAARRGRARCWRRTGCRRRSTPPSTTPPCSPRCSATRSGAAAASASCSSRRRATSGPGAPWSPTTSRALWESWRREEPRGRAARRQPRRARPPPGRALRRPDVRAARVPRSSSSRASSGWRRTSSSPTTRASSSRSCTRPSTTPTRCCSTRARGRTTRGRCATRSS